MSDYINKTPSELLTLLVDGELHDSDASLLFDSLSKSEELRRELLEHLKIRESIRNDVEAFTPPIEATRGVFEQLGIATFAQGTSANALNKGKFMPLFLRLGLPLIAVLITSLITAKVISDHYEAKIAELKNNAPNISSIIGDNQQENISQNSNLIADNTDLKPKFSNVKTNSTVNQINHSSNEVVQISNESVAENEIKTNSYNDLKSITISNNYFDKSDKPSAIRENVSKNIFFSQLDVNIKNYENFRGNSNYLMTFGGVLGKNINSQFNDFASGFNLGFYPIVSNDLRIGFIVGREPFGIELLNASNNQYENDPKSPITWAGVAGRYEFSTFILFNTLTPYSQATIGATEYGMLTKISAGLQIELLPNIETAIGAEYSLLRYKSQMQTHYNNKLGFTANLLFHF